MFFSHVEKIAKKIEKICPGPPILKQIVVLGYQREKKLPFGPQMGKKHPLGDQEKKKSSSRTLKKEVFISFGPPKEVFSTPI